MNKNYLAEIKKIQEFRLAIMGKDPYPNNANGIPFSKDRWSDFEDYRCSGKYIIDSLGIRIENAKKKFKSPNDLFLFLLKKHQIVFLNISYTFLGDGAAISKKKHSVEINASLVINKPILIKSDSILLCGQAKKLRLFYKDELPSREVFHPDFRNISKSKWKDDWDTDKLKKTEKLKITI
jgi:hypothetical protein